MPFSSYLALDGNACVIKPIRQRIMTPCFFAPGHAGEMHRLLERPNRYFLEMGPRAKLEGVIDAILAESPDFALNITTPTAYSGNIASMMGNALESRFSLPAQQCHNLTTCLHEALSNAVIHGNLGLESPPTDLQEDFEAYYNSVSTLIHEAPYHQRRIGISVVRSGMGVNVSVSDEGKGFVDTSLLEHIPKINSYHNRGLYLIRAMASDVWIEEDRRTLTMRFISGNADCSI